jgi:hypothetical protein
VVTAFQMIVISGVEGYYRKKPFRKFKGLIIEEQIYFF